MYFDFKITVWERVNVPEEIQQEVLELIKKGEITSTEDLYQKYPNEDISHKSLDNTEEQMTPSANNGCATIQVCNFHEETLFTNSKN